MNIYRKRARLVSSWVYHCLLHVCCKLPEASRDQQNRCIRYHQILSDVYLQELRKESLSSKPSYVSPHPSRGSVTVVF